MSNNQPDTNKDILNTVVVGAEEEAARAVSIINRQGQQRNIIKLQPMPGWKKDAIAYAPDEIIFCEGLLSYRQIIEWVQELPHEISIKIHSNGSRSIVGSHSKNTSGNVMA